MGRTLTFQLIQDNRFSKTPKGDVSRWAKNIKRKLSKHPSVNIRFYDTRKVDFGDGVISYRKKVHISKNSKDVTWNQIYGIVNSEHAPVYRFI